MFWPSSLLAVLRRAHHGADHVHYYFVQDFSPANLVPGNLFFQPVMGRNTDQRARYFIQSILYIFSLNDRSRREIIACVCRRPFSLDASLHLSIHVSASAGGHTGKRSQSQEYSLFLHLPSAALASFFIAREGAAVPFRRRLTIRTLQRRNVVGLDISSEGAGGVHPKNALVPATHVRIQSWLHCCC